MKMYKGMQLCSIKLSHKDNQWYEPRGKPRPPIPQQAAGNLPGEIK